MAKMSVDDKLGFDKLVTDEHESHIQINEDYHDEAEIKPYQSDISEIAVDDDDSDITEDLSIIDDDDIDQDYDEDDEDDDEDDGDKKD